MSYKAYPDWISHSNSSGAAFYGDLMVLQTRWHELIKPGIWCITTSYKSHFHSYNCVVDEFGTLVPVD